MSDPQEPGRATDAAARGSRRRQRTRSAAIDAAEQLLSELAPEEVRVEDVASRAGISPASVYAHFGTKDALLAAVTDRVLGVATQALRTAYAADVPPLERFAGVGAAYMRLLLDHPVVIRYLAATGERGPGGPADQAVSERFDELRREFEASIRDAVEAGALRPVDPERLSYFLFGAWNGVAALALRRDGLALTPDQVEQAVVEAGLVLLDGLLTGIRPA